MTGLPEDPGARHRAVAARFTACVEGVRDWDAPTPVPQWRARDVVDHLVGWLPGFLASGGQSLDRDPDLDTAGDPVTAWTTHAAAVQGLLDDPRAATGTFTHPHLPTLALGEAVSRYYTADVFLHTWDLARATDQDDRLDEDTCAVMLAGMEPMADQLQASGQYGPPVPVPAGSSVQDRLLGLIGRDPAWQPPAT